MRTIQFREAVAEAMSEEMRRDEAVYLMGEEVAEYNGAYKASKGMLDEFGPERVIDTPIAEAGFSGIGVGSTMTGARPIIEFMTFNFSLVGIDQIINNAAKIRQMSGGQFNCPIVFRGPTASAGQLGATHSQAFESWYANCPGLKVIVPSNPADAKGLLKAAIRDDDPVFLVNDKKLINLTGFVPDEDYVIELGKGRYMQRGDDVTLVGMSYTSIVCDQAAGQLADAGINAEVIDMMSLSPFDEDILLESVQKTNNVVIVDEDTPRASMASEFAAVIADKAFDHLDAPIKRVTGPHSPVPYNKGLENAFMPQPEDVVGTVRNMLGRD